MMKNSEFTPGPANLLCDVPGLVVGNAEDHQVKSGVTVVTAERPFATSVHVMGGAPGSRETDLLASDKLVSHADALVLAGGSALGLDAASAVADRLRAIGRGYNVHGQFVPIVPSAIIFDLHNGGDKNWAQNPYSALGRQALDSASADYALGSAGAGFGALTPVLKGGLGSASLRVQLLPDGAGNSRTITVAALVVANPLGCVTVADTPHFWAAAHELDREFGGLGPAPAESADPLLIPPRKPLPSAGTNSSVSQGENTTLAVVATDANLDVMQLQRLATAAHDGFARAIYPAHTPMDGDLVFALSTTHGHDDEGVMPDLELQLLIGHVAATCVSRAIARAVFEATPAPGDVLPAWSEKFPAVR